MGVLPIDLMPTENILGFQNKWYPIAFKTAKDYKLDEHTIKLIHPIYFLATKFEAYNNRGNGDLLGSKDIEDIFIVLNGRGQLYEEIVGFRSQGYEVVEFIQEQFRQLMNHKYFPYKTVDYPKVENIISRILGLS